jgi:tetratricopeptide (TPR) repeat protein
VFDVVSNRKQTITALSRIMQLQKQQRYADVVGQFFELDEPLQQNRLLNIINVKASNLSQDMQLYEKALANLERYYGDDPNMAFLLIDYYFMQGRYPKVIATVNSLQSSFGVDDAALIALKANTFLMQGRYDHAAELAVQAIEVEPEYEHSYWSLFSARVGAGQYRPAVEAAKVLQERFNYDMSPSYLIDIVPDETFLESSEYKNWRARL